MKPKIIPVAAAAFFVLGFAQPGEAQYRGPSQPEVKPSAQKFEIPTKPPTRVDVEERASLPDSRKMVEILKGEKRTARPSTAAVDGRSGVAQGIEKTVAPKPVLERRVTPAREALPKGMAQQAPAVGQPGEADSGAAPVCYNVDAASQLTTNSVKFRKASTQLDGAESFYYLQNLAAALRDPCFAGERFVIEGHASADGSDYTNLVLSQRRANAIFDYLVSAGVHPQRLLAVGHGEAHARFSEYEPEYLLAEDRQVMVFRLAD